MDNIYSDIENNIGNKREAIDKRSSRQTFASNLRTCWKPCSSYFRLERLHCAKILNSRLLGLGHVYLSQSAKHQAFTFSWDNMRVSIFIAIFSCIGSVTSFVLPSIGPRPNSLWASLVDPSTETEAYSVATQLLEIIKRQREENSNLLNIMLQVLDPSRKDKSKADREEITTLIQQLCDLETTYDPLQSLLGNLYCTVFSYTPSKKDAEPPLWEKISLRPDNLKGQQYFLSRELDLRLINYAEIWGPALAIQAQGRLEAEPVKTTTFVNPFAKTSPSKSTNRPCPDVFSFQVEQADLCLLGQQLPIPIRGQAPVVLLYADPRLRILVSPERSDSVVGPWEQAGLVVLQIRSDCLLDRSIDRRQ